MKGLHDDPEGYCQESILTVSCSKQDKKLYIGLKFRIWNAGPDAEHVVLPPQSLRQFPECREENQPA
jgi:hypothetical protein